jgi:hypothetical protein
MALTNRFTIDFTNYATFYSDFAYKGGSTEGTRSCTMFFSSSKNSIGTQQTGYTNIDISNRTDKYIHLMFYVSHDSFGTWGATQMYLKSKNVITITERDEVSVNINIMDIRNNNKNVDSIELYIDGVLYETYNEFKSNIIFSPDVEGNVEVGVIVKYTENGISGTFATSLTTNLVHHEPVVNIVDNNDMLYISTENETFSTVNKIDVYINSLLSKTYNENFSYNEYTIDKSLYGICDNEITVDIFYDQSGVNKKVKRTLVKPYNVSYLLSTDDIVKVNERLKILVNTKNIEKKNLIKILNNKNFNLNETNKMIDIIKLVEQLDSTNDNAELLSRISNLTSELNLYYNNLYNVLEEEGVSVTEEDDMSSLISKVDEEFDKQVIPEGTAVASNVDKGKTFINSTGKVVTGTSTKVAPAGTAVASDVLSGKTFINSTGKTVTGTMANRGGAQTVTPGTSNKTLNAGYYSGNITVKGDSNLIAENIVSGKSIFGVTGTAKTGSMQFATGTFDYDSSVSSITVTTNLDFTPQYIFVLIAGSTMSGDSGQTGKNIVVSNLAEVSFTGNNVYKYSIQNISSTSFKFNCVKRNVIQATITCNWYAFG